MAVVGGGGWLTWMHRAAWPCALVLSQFPAACLESPFHVPVCNCEGAHLLAVHILNVFFPTLCNNVQFWAVFMNCYKVRMGLFFSIKNFFIEVKFT